MSATFVVVPQWQGSSSSRAMQLVDGVEAIRADLPSSATRVIEVPLEAGDAQGSAVHRLSSIAMVRDRITEALAGVTDVPIVIGGDCGVELGAIGKALAERPELAVVWFDAHPDLNTPASSPSGSFHGMVLRALLGDCEAALVPPVPLRSERLVLAGTRACDVPEEEFIAESGIPKISGDPQEIVAAVAATGAESVYVHIDLDVLDPGEFKGLHFPEPFGMSLDGLLDSIAALRERFDLAGAGITEFAPASALAAADDLPAVLRIVGALAQRVAPRSVG